MRHLVGVGLVVLAIVLPALVTGIGHEAIERGEAPDVDLVGVTENDSLWPHTSRTRSVTGRTLAINLFVVDDAESVADSLGWVDDPDWQPTNETVEEPNVTVETGSDEIELVWQAAHGGTRYTYVERDGTGRWLDERRQLHSGTYLATRDHVRLYTPADSSGWTALQVHGEYWDWFRLRHTVTDVAHAREQLHDSLTARSYRTVDRSPAEGSARADDRYRAGDARKRRARDTAGTAPSGHAPRPGGTRPRPAIEPAAGDVRRGSPSGRASGGRPRRTRGRRPVAEAGSGTAVSRPGARSATRCGVSRD